MPKRGGSHRHHGQRRTPYDLGFALETFIVGPPSGFITDESGKIAIMREPRIPFSSGTDPGPGSTSQTERRQDLPRVSCRLDVFEHLGNPSVGTDHEGRPQNAHVLFPEE